MKFMVIMISTDDLNSKFVIFLSVVFFHETCLEVRVEMFDHKGSQQPGSSTSSSSTMGDNFGRILFGIVFIEPRGDFIIGLRISHSSVKIVNGIFGVTVSTKFGTATISGRSSFFALGNLIFVIPGNFSGNDLITFSFESTPGSSQNIIEGHFEIVRLSSIFSFKSFFYLLGVLIGSVSFFERPILRMLHSGELEPFI